MHPLLNNWRQTAALFLSWIVFCTAVIYVVHLITELSLTQAVTLSLPIAVGELLIFLAVWFLCKVTPLNTAGLGTFLLRHGITFVVMSALGLQLSMMYGAFLSEITQLPVYQSAFQQVIPVLLIISFLVYFSGTSISYLIITLQESRQKEREALQSKLQAGEQELKFLKSRIHPHFLFNSLNGLAALTIKDPQKARQLSLTLSEFLRYSFDYSKNSFVSLAEELKHSDDYMAIEATRLGKRLKFVKKISADREKEFMISFCLQPLLENAIKHGVENFSGGSTVELGIESNNHFLVVDISNPWKAQPSERPGSGFGLKNLRQRLQRSYGENARLTIHKGEQYFSVRVFLPRMTNPVEADAPVSDR